jgi:toxin ParE1/3/4
MPLYHLSDQASADLDSIWDRIAADNNAAADRVIAELTATLKKLARWREIGRVRSDLGISLRSFAVGNHVISYRAGGRWH